MAAQKYAEGTSQEVIDAYLKTEQELKEPVVFPKHSNFSAYHCCWYWGDIIPTVCLQCIAPLDLFCPRRVTQHFSLKLSKDELEFNTADNDCCCHVAESQKTVPLDKVLEVELEEDCCQTCFSLKQVNVQTAASSGAGAEVQATFLANPEQARDAIRLAVKQAQARKAPAQEGGMERVGPGAGSSLHERLQRLEDLVARGVLSPAERDALRAPVLAAQADPTLKLVEAADMRKEGLLPQADYEALRSRLVAQAMSA